jgi:hypothetical protein
MNRALLAICIASSPALALAQLPLPPRADHEPDRAAPRAGPCVDPEYRQFDFWVGRWAVSPTGSAKVVAQSLIERLYDGCAIRENWMPVGQAGGGSLSSYVRPEHAWRQAWVDSSGARAEFKGGWNGQAMVLTGPWPLPNGRARLVRMTYTQGADGSVRQAGEASLDDGRTWKPTFDFTYRPVARRRP